MSTLSSIAVTCFILLSYIQITEGLACYSCVNCNDPFNPNYIQVLYQNDSSYYCSKTMAGYNTSRSMTQGCPSSGTYINSVWCCQTNLCNGAKRNMVTNAFSFGIGILMFIIFFQNIIHFN